MAVHAEAEGASAVITAWPLLVSAPGILLVTTHTIGLRTLGVVIRLALVVATLDQLLKAAALVSLAPGMVVDVIPGFIALRLGANRGVSFGLLDSLPDEWRWLPAALSLVALAVIAGVGRTALAAGRSATAPLGLIGGGAVGNLVDRLRVGAVTDYLDVHWRGWHWPAFNLADAAITIGITVLALTLSVRDRTAVREG